MKPRDHSAPTRRLRQAERNGCVRRVNSARAKRKNQEIPRGQAQGAGPSAPAVPWLRGMALVRLLAAAQSPELLAQGGELLVPVGQALTFLRHHGGWGVRDEGFAGELAVALGDFAFDPLDLLAQSSAFGVEIDEAG